MHSICLTLLLVYQTNHLKSESWQSRLQQLPGDPLGSVQGTSSPQCSGSRGNAEPFHVQSHSRCKPPFSKDPRRTRRALCSVHCKIRICIHKRASAWQGHSTAAWLSSQLPQKASGTQGHNLKCNCLWRGRWVHARICQHQPGTSPPSTSSKI